MILNVEVRYNDTDNRELFCTFSKERIQLGEKFCYLLVELYSGEVEKLPYKLENLPASEDCDEDDAYVINPT
jgi:hypothetical protein